MAIKRKSFFMIFRILMLFLGGMVVALVIALSQVNLETLRGNILSVLRESTGLPVEIDGAVSWKFSLRPRIELDGVRVQNADWAHHKYAFSAEHVDVTLNLVSLLRNRPTIQNVRIYDATVCIEQNDAGQYSVMPASKKKKNPESELTEENIVLPEKYPFEDLGLGGIEVHNLAAHILGDSYSLAGFQIRYMPNSDGREYSGWLKSDTSVFPFIVSLSEYNPERKIYPVRVAFATGGDALIANIALEGTSKMPIDFVIKGDIPDISVVGRIINWDIGPMPKMAVNVAGGLDHNKFTLRKSSLTVRGTKFSFWGDFDWGQKIPSVNFNLESGRVVLAQLFPEMYGHNVLPPKRELNIFKDIPLFGDFCVGKNLNLNIKLKTFIVYRDLDLPNTNVMLNVRNNVARLDGTVGIGGGKFKFGADIDIASDGKLNAVVGALGRDISVGTILSQVRENDLISDLPLNFEAYLRGDGYDLSDLMKTATGPVQVYSSGRGYIHSALVSYMYGTDFLTSLRHSIQDLFNSEKKHNQIKISCLALNTKLRNGVAETQQGFALETNAVNMRLAGTLNLGDENIKMALMTVPVRGLKLSLTGNVVNAIEITGNLAEPDIKISGTAVAGKVASATGIGLLLAPFTGGLGLVAGAGVGLLAGDLLENWLADDHPCETAMRRGGAPRRHDPEWMDKPIPELLQSVLGTDYEIRTKEQKEETND